MHPVPFSVEVSPIGVIITSLQLNTWQLQVFFSNIGRLSYLPSIAGYTFEKVQVSTTAFVWEMSNDILLT